ncbi:VapE domain-containing protein [Thioalkalivibrio sp. ALJT]|uniref:VapE domain-containing protein n=1 Tax=Thioalkalivibrio sp. ALJT TaxID=1158146 RepID=UPI00036B6877|nr:VapE domain-containing protein [Thioalkalivibrio sp. ALJT]
MTAIQHDTAAALDFLRRWSPDADWCLTAIIPDGKTETATFKPTEEEKARAWIDDRQGHKNLYFHVNATRGRRSSKPKKPDMAAFRAFHVDIDPAAGEDFEEERQRIAAMLSDNLPEGIPAPSVVIDSGGGFQAFWLLAHPLPIDKPSEAAPEPWADGEAYNRSLELAFRADSCHNCDRLMRLPGTVNLPNKKKASKGRVPTLARLLSWEGTRYPLDHFDRLKVTAKPAPSAPSATPTASGKAAAVLDLGDGMPMGTEELREWAETNGKTLKDATLARIATGTDPLDPTKYPSRSEALWAVVCDLVRADVDDGVIFRVITGPNEIAASVRDKSDPKRYALDQIAKARALIESQPTWDRVNKEGEPQPSYWNTRTALQLMGVECRYDKFRDRHLIGSHELQEFNGEFSDHAERILRDEIIRRFGFDPGDVNVNKAVLSLCTENRFDSLIDHIQALPPWDGTPRLDTWLTRYLGTEENAYTREAGAAWLMAAIVRAFEPGAKFDQMLVLMGAQGVGKSTALRILAGDEFFSDAPFLHARDAREVLEVTAGVWILECAELDGIGKRDVNTLRATITRQVDAGRPAYARSPVTMPRRFVLGGTTNEDRFLLDPAGNRRFWPVEVTRVDLEGLAAARNQLFAEALARYRAGKHSLLLGPEASALAKDAQDRRRVVDEGFIESLEGLREGIQTWKGQWIIKTSAIYDRLGMPTKDRNGAMPRKVKEAMTALGWKPGGPARIDGELCRFYVWEGEGNPGSLTGADGGSGCPF